MSFFYKHKLFSILMINVGLLLSLGLIGELVLYYTGQKPGIIIDDPYLKLPDTIYEKPDFITDDQGFFHVSAEYREIVNEEIRTNGDLQIPKEFEGTLWGLLDDFRFLEQDDRSSFKKYIGSLNAKSSLRAKLILDYSKQPLNSLGYRSIEFIRDTSTISILLLGDSYTWGLSAHPIYNSFPDLLLTKGYTVYNTGNVGQDPADYLHLALKYINDLSPDIVIVNFYMGNDQMDFKREILPNQSSYYVTNGGWIDAASYGRYWDLEDAYAIHKHYCDISAPTHPFGYRALGFTRLGTRLFILLNELSLIQIKEPSKFKSSMHETHFELCQKYTNYYLEQIDSLCRAQDAAFICSIIFDEKAWEDSQTKVHNGFFDVLVYYCDSLSIEDYIQPNGEMDHFNNIGHVKYARYLDQLISERLE